MKYGVISGGKKIRSTVILSAGKIFNIKPKSLLIFVLLLNASILILLYMMIYLAWIMIRLEEENPLPT